MNQRLFSVSIGLLDGGTRISESKTKCGISGIDEPPRPRHHIAMVEIDANITNSRGRPRDAILVAAVNPDGSLISAGGGTPGGATEATQAEILMTLSELEQDVGHAEDAAWSGSGPGTLIAVTKAVYAQQQTMIALLQQIRDNTMAS